MPSIKVNLPQFATDQFCTPTDTLNRYYCFYNKITSGQYVGNFGHRATIIIDGDIARTSRIEQNNYTGYDVSSYPNAVYAVDVYPELSQFWFPLISVIMVGLIFFAVYKILFSRFIK